MNIYILSVPDDLYDTWDHWMIAAWIENSPAVMKLFKWVTRGGGRLNQNITGHEALRELMKNMPRKKGQNGSTKSNRFGRDNGGMQQQQLKWLNLKLEDADIDALEQSSATLEYLAGCVCGLASDGVGVSIRAVDEGASFCVTIIGSDLSAGGVPLGVSSFAGELRDALLVCLYKYSELMGSTFDNASRFLQASQSRQRFR